MKISLLVTSTFLLAGSVSAQVVSSESFGYVGALTANGWSAHSGAGNKVIMSNGLVTTLEFSGGSGEDVNLPCAQFDAAATCYASFVLNVPSGNPVNPDNNGSYFAHFKDESFAFRARTGLLSPVGTGDFGIGINADSSSIGSGAVWPADLAFDTNYTIVISWNAATGESMLWVDPVSAASASISHTGTNTGDVIEQFAWRQSADHTGFILVDSLVVGGSFTDVTVPDSANEYLRADSELGCVGLPLHYTSAVSPADPSMPATWAAGTNAVLTVANVDPVFNIGVLAFGFSSANLPLFGGLLIPTPDIIEVVTGAAGTVSLSISIPAGLSGATLWTQFATFDTCVTAGNFAFSNGQRHLLP